MPNGFGNRPRYLDRVERVADENAHASPAASRLQGKGVDLHQRIVFRHKRAEQGFKSKFQPKLFSSGARAELTAKSTSSRLNSRTEAASLWPCSTGECTRFLAPAPWNMRDPCKREGLACSAIFPNMLDRALANNDELFTIEIPVMVTGILGGRSDDVKLRPFGSEYVGERFVMV